jgi:GNAT superfamily N-acetyltransferase
MSRWLVRRFLEEDFDPVTRLWRRAREVAIPELTARLGYSFDMDCNFFRRHIIPACELWVADQNGRPVGFLGLHNDFVNYVYVDPDFHRQGIGTAFLSLARRGSPGHLWLYTHQANKMARTFYEKNGFIAERFGISPPPESEPDVEYHWRPVA